MRARIFNLEPNDTGALLDYIEAALMFHEPKLARNLLLHRADVSAKNDARYYHLLSVSDFLKDDLPRADAASEEAIRRDPTNKEYRINQAIIRLSCPDPTVRQAALESLEALSSDSQDGVAAIQALLNYAASAGEEPQHFDLWLEAARNCISPRNAFFTSYLSALRRWRPNQFDAPLAAYIKAGASEGGDALATQRWLTKNGLYEQALTFRESLPTAIQSSSESRLLAAEAMFALQRADELSALLQGPEWKQNQTFQMAWTERIRRAALRREEVLLEANANWRRILTLARDDPKQLSTLAQMADGWHWPQETEMALWSIADKAPGLADAALQDLARRTLARGDSNALRQVLRRQSRDNPDDPVAANNLAFLCFLLRRETTQATRLSDDLCRRFPQSPPLLATSAFGRLTQGDISGGLKLFEKVDTKALEGTAPGVTYGLLLAANGDPLAAGFLRDAESWTHFPEERQLIAEARKKIEP